MAETNFKPEEKNYLLKKELEINEKKVKILIDLLNEKSETFENDLKEFELLLTDNVSENPFDNTLSDRHAEFASQARNFRLNCDRKTKNHHAANRKIDELNLKLSDAERIKSEFLNNTSHEFRTPLNAIMGYLELIKEGLYDTPEEMNEFLDGALKSSQHLLKILSDLIDIARTESRKIKVTFGEVNLKQLCEEIYMQYHAKAITQGIDFSMEMPEENLIVRGDQSRIKQIFDNLLSNAFKFTTSIGKITIIAKETKSQSHVLCEIIDNGIGISEDHRKKIFDRFYQVDGSSTREYGGTGIGLPLTKSYVELMGGFIGVYSEGPDRGSKFYFTLPVYHHDDEVDLNKKTPDVDITIAGDPSDPLILLVEDDSNYRRYLSELLVKNGYSTISASTADDALSRITEYKPNLIILDLALPRRVLSNLHHGIDLYKLVKGRPEFENIPVIIISGHTGEIIELFHEDVSINYDLYFEKPFDQNTLIKKINLLLSGVYSERKNIVLIENDPKICNIISKSLPSKEYHLKSFTNGKDFLKFIATSTYIFDLLIINQFTIQMNQDEIIGSLSERFAEIPLPIMIITLSTEFTYNNEIKNISRGKLDLYLKSQLLLEPSKFYDRIKNFLKQE